MPLRISLLPKTHGNTIVTTSPEEISELKRHLGGLPEQITRFRRFRPEIQKAVDKCDIRKNNKTFFRIKRGVDVALAALGLAVTAPAMLFAAAAVKHEVKTPVLFKQKRIGYRGKEFVVYKIRSFDVKSKVGRVGRIIRKYGIDELPQLWNVLKGDMSFIGPRALPVEDILPMIEKNGDGVLRRFSVQSGFGIGVSQEKQDYTVRHQAESQYLQNCSVRNEMGVWGRILKKILTGDNV